MADFLLNTEDETNVVSLSCNKWLVVIIADPDDFGTTVFFPAKRI